MVQSSSSDKTTTNKGVNVLSELLPTGIHKFLGDNTSSSPADTIRSVRDIRNEIQNVLDMMGPTTSTITNTHNSSSEADNEESQISEIKFTKTVSSSSGGKNSADNSKLIDSERNKDSIMADMGTYSSINNNSEELETSCCHHSQVYISPECMCMIRQVNTIPAPSGISEGQYLASTRSEHKKRGLFDWLKEMSPELKFKKSNSNPCELYRINICGQDVNGAPPKRVVFDLVDGIPKPTHSVATNTIRSPIEKYKTRSEKSKSFVLDGEAIKNIKNKTISNFTPAKIQKNYYDSEGNRRVDFNYFDHGNAQYFHTTDTPPVLKSEIIADKTEHYTTRFWAEFFSSIHIGVSFGISFILQLIKFLLYGIFRPLSTGVMQMGSDYFVKPFLTTFFNGIIQPFLIFLYNIMTSIRDLCDPLAEAVGYFCRELAILFRSIRLCAKTTNTNQENACDCYKKCKCGKVSDCCKKNKNVC